MKRISIGLLAMTLAIVAVSFTKNERTSKRWACDITPGTTVYYWFHVDPNISVSCGSVAMSDLLTSDLPVADGLGDSQISDDFPTQKTYANNDWLCPGSGSDACALGYISTTVSDFEVIDFDPDGAHDYRWRPKSGTTIDCCIQRP